MKKVIVVLLVRALLGGGGYGAYYYFIGSSSTSGERVSSSSDDAVYVETVASIMGYSTGSGALNRYSGEVEAQATLEVKLDSERTVDECYVEVGDIVEEGQKLFSYDTQEDEDNIAQNEIEIERLQMEIESYETQIATVEKQMASYTDEDDKTEASLEIMSMENYIKQDEYEIQSKELENESLQETIDEAVVTAEMGGIVQKIADTNDTSDYYSSSSDDSVYITILAEGDYRVKGTINELNYSDIYEGLSMVVYSRVDSSLTWTGTVTEINTEQDEDDSDYYYSYSSSDTSTYSFYVQLDDSDGLLLGQHVYMEIDAGQTEEKEGLWLEEFYINEDEDGSYYVWLANTSNVIEKRVITLGEYDELLAEYEVLDGLEWEDYIAFPSDTISEGDPVLYFDIAATYDDSSSADSYADDDDDVYYDLDDEDYYDLDDEDYYDLDDEDYYDDEDDDVYYADDEDDEIYYADDEDDEIYYADDEDDEIYYADDEDDEIYYADDEDDEDYYED